MESSTMTNVVIILCCQTAVIICKMAVIYNKMSIRFHLISSFNSIHSLCLCVPAIIFFIYYRIINMLSSVLVRLSLGNNKKAYLLTYLPRIAEIRLRPLAPNIIRKYYSSTKWCPNVHDSLQYNPFS